MHFSRPPLLWGCLALLLGSALILFIRSAQAGERLLLASEGKAHYQIVLDEPDSPVAAQAARQLGQFLHQITGAIFEIRSSREANVLERPSLVVGNGELARQLEVSPLIETLTGDATLLHTVGQHVVMAGPQPRGTLYAVFEFLERHLDCQWWSPGQASIPHRPELSIPPLKERYQPALEYRVAYTEAIRKDDLFAVRMRTSGRAYEAPLPEALGGSVEIIGFVHTFDKLVPAKDYFPGNPQWGAYREGQRVPWGQYQAQPCLSNPEFLTTLTRNVLEKLEGVKAPAVISVSQNDNQNRCLCAPCRAIEEEEQSPAGPILRAVNQVAAEVARLHPGIRVETLAYTYSSPPPQVTRPLDNVIIQLSTYHDNHSVPFDQPGNEPFQKALKGWRAITQHLYLWDYTTDFHDQWMLRPNLRFLGKNIAFFARSGVEGIFSQGAFRQKSDFADLRTWLVAQLLWNPQQDASLLIRRFLQGYYGAASPALEAYLDLLDATARETPLFMIGGGVAQLPFPPRFFEEALLLFDQASAAVAWDKERLRRVKIERLAVEYLRIAAYPDSLRRGAPLFSSSKEALAAGEAFGEQVKALGIEDEDGYLAGKLERYRMASQPIAPITDLALGEGERYDFPAPQLYLHGYGKSVFLVPEPQSATGYAATLSARTPAWSVQLPATPGMNGKRWNGYARVRYQGKGNALVTLGGYDPVAQEKTKQTQVVLSGDDGSQWVALLDISMNYRSYLYLSVAQSDDPAGQLVIDRMVLAQP